MDCYEEERKSLDFDREELSNIIYGGKEGYKTHKKIIKYFAEDPVLKIDHTFYDLPREKQLEINMKRAVRMNKLNETTDFPAVDSTNIGIMADYSNSVGALGLHHSMFEFAIKNFGSEEQMKEYVPKIASLEILGCYAQTEIGHGSDVQSLETTATYDKNSD